MGGEDQAAATRLGHRFEIKRELGSGASGTVYCVRDGQRRTELALKLLRAIDSAALIRFKREFRSLAGIVNPHLVTLYELGSENDTWFLLMELIEGVPLLDYVRPYQRPLAKGQEPHQSTLSIVAADFGKTANTRPGESMERQAAGVTHSLRRQAIRAATVDLDRLVGCLGQLALGLTCLHQAGKLHCDLKHSNVLVEADGRTVLCDFGLISELGDSTAINTRRVRGTPGYMSPEQAAGKESTEASDWYSAGVMLFEALTGELPFDGTAAQVMRAKNRQAAPTVVSLAPTADPTLAKLCDALLACAPEDRATAADVFASVGLEAPSNRPVVAGGSPRGLPPFVGRQPELDELEDALGRSRGACTPIFVGGQSGMGKSALCRRFIEAARASGAVAITGRCYERESVPHKALDSLADNLCTHIMGLADPDSMRILGDDAGALARLFPVFGRLVVNRPDQDDEGAPVGDAQTERRDAFDAFIRIVRRLASQQPTILFIDDMQWGDVDSASFFSSLVNNPEPVGVLLLATYGADHVDGSALLRGLLRPESPSYLAPRIVTLEGLTDADASELAHTMVSGTTDRKVSELVADAGGHPLFLTELARMGGTVGDHASDLEGLLRHRIEQLPQEARSLLEASAIAARPMPAALLSQAAEIRDEPAAIATLVSAHLLRSTVLDDQEQLVPYHSRIRHAAISRLTDDASKHWHRRIARALEWNDDAEPIALVEHWMGAGARRKAATYAAAAARRAEDALAFAQAAQYYRILIDLGRLKGTKLVVAWTRRAEMLVHAGSLADAAQSFLEAAAHATPEQATTLRGQASSELIRSGSLKQGLALAKEVLAEVGLSLPASKPRIIASILTRRAWQKARGLHFRERPEHQQDVRLLRRVDACQALTAGLSFVLPAHGAYLHTRQLPWALASGDPHRAAIALSLEIGFRSVVGAKARPQLSELVRLARKLGEQNDNPGVTGFVLAGIGVSDFLAGEFESAANGMHEAARLLRSSEGYTLRWQRALAEIYELNAVMYLGQLHELTVRVPMLLRQALESGDEYLARALRAWRTNLVWLARDEPEVALEQARAGAPDSDDSSFTIQHYHELVTRTQIDLYTGAYESAFARVDRGFKKLRRTMHLRIQSLRVEGRFVQARAALAAAAATTDASHRASLLTLARDSANLLEKEGVAWALGKAALVRATIAHLSGTRETTSAELERAIREFDRAAMAMHATVARLRLGSVLGGDRGHALMSAANRSMQAETVGDPERFANLYAPGW